MEFDIDSFLKSIFDTLKGSVPYESPQNYADKHAKRSGARLKDLFDLDKNTIITNINMRTVDVGSPMAEAKMPHYHILQQAEVIRKRGKGTTTSKGSQDKEKNLLLRDYERVSFNGKTFSKEYNKNVRGQRSKARLLNEPKLRYINGQYVANEKSNSYVNIYYQYIDKILDRALPFIANDYGMKMSRKLDTGLQEEYALQMDTDYEENLPFLNMIDSFME